MADRGYASHMFRQRVWDFGDRPAVATKSNEPPAVCPAWIYNNHNRVERFWARMKEWRAMATRYEKSANSFMGRLCLKAALDWIKN